MENNGLSFHEICGRIINGETELFKQIEISSQDVVIANFMQLKETYIDKERLSETSYKLHFDYEVAKKVIWDICFLGKYIYEKSDLKTREEIERKADSEVGKGYDYSGIYFEFHNMPTSFSEADLKELKRNIIAIQKVRDTFGHSEVNVNNNCFEFRNTYSSCYLMCDLPLKYLQFFGAGIVPNLEDNKIASACDSYLERQANYVVTENSSYRILPSNLKRINEVIEQEVQKRIVLGIIPQHLRQLLIDGKYKELKQRMGTEIYDTIPMCILRTSKKRLDFLLEITKNDIDKLISLPNFMCYANYEKVQSVLSRINYDLEKLTTYPQEAMSCSKERLEHILKMIGNDVENIKKVSPRIFSAPLEISEYIYQLVNHDVELFVNVPAELYNFSLAKLQFFTNKLGMTIDQIVNLNPHFRNCPKNKIMECLKMVDNDPARLNDVAFFALPRNFTQEEIEFFQSLSKEEFVLANRLLMDCTKSLIDMKSDSVMFVIKYGIKHNFEYQKFTQLISKASRCELSFIQYLFSLTNGDIDKLLQVPSGIFIYNGNKLNFLLSCVDNKLERLQEFELNLKTYLPQVVFSPKCDISKLKLLLSYVNNEPARLSEYPPFVFYDECQIERIELLLRYIKEEMGQVDVSKLKGLTTSAFTCSQERLETLYELGNRKIESLYGLSTFIFGETISVEKIKFLLEYTKDDNGQTDISKLKKITWTVYKSTDNRIKLVMDLIGNDITLLRTVPKELFFCSDDELVTEVYQQYSENMIKSIFGVSDEKTIALMLYMNSVFREKGKDDVNYRSFKLSELDLSSADIKNMNGNLRNHITSMLNLMCVPNSINKKNDVTTIQLSQIDNLNNEFNMKILNQNKELCRFLRNCSEHFRIYSLGNGFIKLVDGNMSAIFDVKSIYSIVSGFYEDNKKFDHDEWYAELASRVSLLRGSFTQEMTNAKWYPDYKENLLPPTEESIEAVKTKMQEREEFINISFERVKRNDFLRRVILTKSDSDGLKKVIGYPNILNELYIKLQHMEDLGLSNVVVFNAGSCFKVSYEYNGVKQTVELDELWNNIINTFGEPENLKPVLKF